MRDQFIQVSAFTRLQCQYQLISQCLSRKLHYIFRNVPPCYTQSIIPLYDEMLQKALGENIGCPLSPQAWFQARLGYSNGGLDLASSKLFNTQPSWQVQSQHYQLC